MNPVSGDVICLSGYSFCCKDNTQSLVGFARICQGEAFPVLFDVGPMVADIELDVLQTVNGLHPIWSLNECEGPILAGRLGRQPDVRDETGLECICRSLSLELHNPVVLRAGALGASCCQTRDAGLSQYIPTPQGPRQRHQWCRRCPLGRPLRRSAFRCTARSSYLSG